MKERPILFSAPMVRAILDGSKTQTRRAINYKRTPYQSIEEREDGRLWPWREDLKNSCDYWYPSPYGQLGDRLWVKETWTPLENVRTSDPGLDAIQRGLYYRADYPGDTLVHDDRPDEPVKWKSSLFMRRNHSRILLEVTGVRIERLNDCSETDAIAEGIEGCDVVINGRSQGKTWLDYSLKCDDSCKWLSNPINSYRSLWEQINGAGSWEANPWVWVVEFKRINGA